MNDKLKNRIFDDMLEYAVKEEFETVMNNMPKDEEVEEYIPSKEFDLRLMMLNIDMVGVKHNENF